MENDKLEQPRQNSQEFGMPGYREFLNSFGETMPSVAMVSGKPTAREG